MLKKLTASLPPFLITIVQLFALEFLILSFCRVVFYFAFKTVDVSDISLPTVLMAFRMGVEFDMVATTYSLLLPTLLLLLNNFFSRRTLAFHKIALITTLII